MTLVVGVISMSILALYFECQGDPPPLPGVSPRAQKVQAPQLGAKRLAQARAHARDSGTQRAREVVFLAQEINMLDPRSDRAKSSRRARELLDEITGEPGSPSEPNSTAPFTP